MHSLENHTRIQTKTGKVYTRFQAFSDQNGPKTVPFGAAHTYKANIRGSPPPPPPGGLKFVQCGLWFTAVKVEKFAKAKQI